jgi:hypothetical protein
VLQAKEHTPTPYPSDVFTFGFVVEFIKEFGGASQETSGNLIGHGKFNGFTRINIFGQGPLDNINTNFDTFSRLEVISGFVFSNQNFGWKCSLGRST